MISVMYIHNESEEDFILSKKIIIALAATPCRPRTAPPLHRHSWKLSSRPANTSQS